MKRDPRTHLFLALVLAFGAQAQAQQPDLYDETVLRTLHLKFAQSDWWSQLTNNAASQTEIPADLEVDNKTYSGVGVRFKGNSSARVPGQKKPFKIVMDFTDPDQDLYGYTTINLNNCFKDPTFCREVLTYRIARQYTAASKANFIKLVINNENWGVYVNVQQVNKAFMSEWLEDNDGNRYKGDRPSRSGPRDGTAMIWLGSGKLPYEQSYELKSENNPDPWTDLIQVCDVLNNTPMNQLEQALPPVFDVDRALWHLAINNTFASLDSYVGPAHNFYLVHDDHHSQLCLIPWDLNESFGVFTMGMSVTQLQRLNPLYPTQNSARPLVARMLAAPGFRARYFAHMRTLLHDVWDWSTLAPIVQQYQDLIRSEVLADSKKLYSNDAFSRNVTQDYRAGGTIPGLQPFVERRAAYLASHSEISKSVPQISKVSHSPALPKATDTVWVTGKVDGGSVGDVSVWSRARGNFAQAKMFDDGAHHDGAANDGVYGVSIPAQAAGATVDYYLSASRQGGGLAMMPRFASHQPLSFRVQTNQGGNSLTINEFVAKNDTGIVDQQNEYEDWIELYNPTSNAIDASGMYLTDNINDPTKWQIPSGVTVQAGAFVLVWCDDEPTQGSMHATFKLDNDGEEIGLYDSDGSTQLDYIEFSKLRTDHAAGRMYDGQAMWVSFPDPTPRGPNSPSICGGRRYSALEPRLNEMKMKLPDSPKLGASVTFTIGDAPANGRVFSVVAAQPAHIDLMGSVLMLTPPFFSFLSGTADAAGDASLPVTIPNLPALTSLRAYTQTWAASGSNLLLSNAIEISFCR